MNPLKNTSFGFKWGPVEITRRSSDQKRGWIALDLKTNKQILHIYITKTGKVRVYNYYGKELIEVK